MLLLFCLVFILAAVFASNVLAGTTGFWWVSDRFDGVIGSMVNHVIGKSARHIGEPQPPNRQDLIPNFRILF